MKSFKASILLATCALISFYGCMQSDQSTELKSGNTITINLTMPEESPDLRVSLTEQKESLNLLAKFERGEQIIVFIKQGNEVANLGRNNVRNMTSDLRSGEVTYRTQNISSRIDLSKPYTLIGFINNNKTLTEFLVSNLFAPQGKEERDVSVVLYPLNSFKIQYLKPTLYFRAETTGNVENITARVKQMGVYEIIHLRNNSSAAIKDNVRLADKGWANTPLRSWAYDFDPQENNPKFTAYRWFMSMDLIEEDNMFSRSRLPKSFAQNINAGKEGVVCSWYVPREGVEVPESVVVLKVGDKYITSENSFAKRPALEPGYAYHIYATYDGTKLTIDKNAAE